MPLQLKLEELAQFLACLIFLVHHEVAWWVYPILLLGPDIGMLGYSISPRIGALTYNLLHHKGMAVLVFGIGVYLEARHVVHILLGMEYSLIGYHLMIAGIILFGHASMDRMFGFGLKYNDSFQHTHLGILGKQGRSV